MKRIKTFLIFIFAVTLVGNLNGQWQQKTNGIPVFAEGTGQGLAIDASDSLTAVIFIRGNYPEKLIYETTNRGNNWIRLPWTPVDNEGPVDGTITDKNHIWFGTDHGRIYSTSDGGYRWEMQFFDSTKTEFIDYVKMFDNSNGIAMGDPNDSTSPAVFLKTTDGGKTWNQTTTSSLLGLWSGDMWRRLDFINDADGYFYASGSNPQLLYKTTDAGANWTSTDFSGYAQILKFFDSNIGLAYNSGCSACGTVSQMMRTTDGGQSWQNFDIQATGWGNDIEFLPGDPSKAWFTDSYKMFFSSDTGRSWVNVPIHDSTLSGRDIVFTDDHNGWLLCDRGMVYVTSRGDRAEVTSVPEKMPRYIPKNFSLEQNYPNPFNPSTVISYNLPFNSFVTLIVYDELGRVAAVLVNKEETAGHHTVEFKIQQTTKQLSSGIYYYMLQADGYIQTKKMILLK